jgi:hypothetical protein
MEIHPFFYTSYECEVPKHSSAERSVEWHNAPPIVDLVAARCMGYDSPNEDR